MLRKVGKNIKYLIIVLILLALVEYFNLRIKIMEKDFKTTFEYPLTEDIMPLIKQLRNNEVPRIPPINSFNYSFNIECAEKCQGAASPVRLVILVKSAMSHVDRRLAIRKTWGNEKRFFDVEIRTVFLLGVAKYPLSGLNFHISKEATKYKDIVQADFYDTYYNNTIKTMIGFNWVMTYCSKADYFLFADDDMYISVKNVLRFLQNPYNYPNYIEKSLPDRKFTPKSSDYYFENSRNRSKNLSKGNNNMENQTSLFDFPKNVLLYAGNVNENDSPIRFTGNKWFMSLLEYPWNRWPPFVSAGAYILSKETLITLYYASFYVRSIRFDDVYLGILAKKCGMELFHCNEFYLIYNINSKYDYAIASHDFNDPNKLISTWNNQRKAGNA